MQQTPATIFGYPAPISAPKVLSIGRQLENNWDCFAIGVQVSRTTWAEESIVSIFGMVTSGMIAFANINSDLFASLLNKLNYDCLLHYAKIE